MSTGDLTSAGLWLGIIGAFFLAESFVLKRRHQLVQESRTKVGSNPYLLGSSIRQSVEARVGFGFMAVGFASQLIAQTDWLEAGSPGSPLVIFMAAAVVSAIAFMLVWWWSRRRARRAIARMQGTQLVLKLRSGDNIDARDDLARVFGDVLWLPRQDGDTDEQYAHRVADSVEAWSS